MRTVRWAFLLHTLLQAQAPLAVETVVDALTGQTRLAPGSRALIRLNASVAHQPVTAQVGGRQATILGVDGAGVHIAIPVDLDEGPTTLTLVSQAMRTPPFAITLFSHAPA